MLKLLINYNVPVVQLDRILAYESSDKGSTPFMDILKYMMRFTNAELNLNSIIENINKLDDARNGLRQAYMVAAKHNDKVGMKCIKSHYDNINNYLGSIGKKTFDLVDLENVHTVSDLIDL